MAALASASRLTTFRFDGTDYAVLSEDAPVPIDLFALTAAEAAVMALVLEGLSNAEVARRRKVSARTVANQLAALFRKLKIGSRAELMAKVGAKGNQSR